MHVASTREGHARGQHEGEPAGTSLAASERRAPLLRGMEDGMRPCSIRAGALAGWDLGSCSSAMGSAGWPHQQGQDKGILGKPGLEPERLFLALGGRVLLLIYPSSYFWKGVG